MGLINGIANQQVNNKADDFLDHVTRWAGSSPDVIGLALVGSFARGQATADSDIDLILLTPRPQDFVNDPDWVREFGRVKSYEIEKWGMVTSLRVYYEDDLEVEYGLTSPQWASLPLDQGTRQVISDGMKMLVDKVGLLERAVGERSN